LKLENRFLVRILLWISATVILLHLLFLFKFIPFDIVWGGRLKSDAEMLLFEAISIAVNLVFVWVMLQKARFVKPILGEKSIKSMLWFFFGLFVLNTVGNLAAETHLEKALAIVTAALAFLVWKVNGKDAG
jgi:hypothetical protein